MSDTVVAVEAARPYVDKFTSWSYTSHWSSTATWGAYWWADAYQAYVDTGRIPNDAPDAPFSVTGTVVNNKLRIGWQITKGQNIAHHEVIQMTPMGRSVVGSPWNNQYTIEVDFVDGAPYEILTRTAARLRPTPLIIEGGVSAN